MLRENSFKIMNKINKKRYTRVTTSTNNIIENVDLNIKENDFHLAIIDTAMSDHKQIFFEVKHYQLTTLKIVNH